jgi:hypothetical protein
MHRIVGILSVVGLWLVAGALFAGCSSSESGASAAAAFPGAVYAGQLPLYPSATLEGSMGGSTYGRVGGPAVSSSLSWFFTVSDPADKVLAFYEARLSGAARGDDGDHPTLTLVPAGAEEGEYLRITVSPGKLQITEVVRAAKRKDS